MFTNLFYHVLTTTIVILICNKFCSCQIVPNVSCPEIFQYNFDSSELFGIVDLKAIPVGQRFKLNVDMTLNGTIPKNYIGSLDLKVNRKGTTEFKIKFPIPYFLSKLSGIILNGNVICDEPSDGNPIATILKLEQTASGQITFDTSVQSIMKRNTASSILITNSTILNTKLTSTNCGELAGRFKHYPVDYNVGEFERGTWPWIAAIYVKPNTRKKLVYNCVGSLISQNAVLTAAICILYTPNNITVYLGLHNLDRVEHDQVTRRNVSRIYIHPTFKPPSANGDIAILKLSEKVEFSDFVQPACLWVGSKELEDVVGESGYYAGWGIDPKGLLSEIPHKGDSKIVSQEDCLKSYSIFENITSTGTFCAGLRNGEGPCNGYAGAGFFIRKDSKWMLRGMVAKALTTTARRCDLYNYIVYVDVAQYLEWIGNIIKDFL